MPRVSDWTRPIGGETGRNYETKGSSGPKDSQFEGLPWFLINVETVECCILLGTVVVYSSEFGVWACPRKKYDNGIV